MAAAYSVSMENEKIEPDDAAVHLQSRRERYAFGKSLRDAAPREALADFALPADRDAMGIIRESFSTRMKSLRPLRRELMMGSPFAFLRGAADIMAFDLSRQVAPGAKAQACGDCHLMNFGAYQSPEGNVLFDVNDFDETLPQVDFVCDLRRLAASVVVGALDMNFSRSDAREFARRTARSYRIRMRQLAAMSPYDVWNVRVPLRDIVGTLRDRVLHERLSAAIYEGKGPEDRTDGLPKIEKKKAGKWRFVDKPPKLRHLGDMTDEEAYIDLPRIFERLVSGGLQEPVSRLFARYHLCDTAFKAVGVGSVGVFCGVALYMSEDDEPLALQIKAAQPSVLERFGAGRWQGAAARRVAAGQRLMQAATDPFLAAAESHDELGRFYLRHLKTRRLSNIAELLKDQAFPRYVELCGSTLARAHARSSQPAMLAGYMGKGEAFDDAMASFGMLYAKQTMKDWRVFCADAEAV